MFFQATIDYDVFLMVLTPLEHRMFLVGPLAWNWAEPPGREGESPPTTPKDADPRLFLSAACFSFSSDQSSPAL